MMYRLAALVFALLALFANSSALAKETVHIAAASSLRGPLEIIVGNFETQHPEYEVHISYAASGKLVAQVQHGAPYGLVLAAEPDYLEELHARQLTLSAPQHFSYGQLVLWHPQQHGDALDILRDAKRIALAQPRHAPYGKIAMRYLEQEFPDTDFTGRLVYGENVAQAAHRVYAGAVPLGFVALSQMLQLKIPESDYSVLTSVEPLPQAMALTKQAQSGARLLYSALLEDAAQQVLTDYGYIRYVAAE
ncbi:molybdate ABC transporter substrate-binding protein [Pseudidiomarina halophila]|uniref:Molybdate ABC transporter substrate-binding protein n=1 Tax=Pseudidiomarina halophila TaxID=1449799 RepID=A0A432XT00_9GAMM|nr:molybdate ABC transporter substrate-binding protein [Pseudidiomarina halophila]RUO51842.1 molybdate ABC transporter substrate-binding protein [Pseudidiomarina halophila]